MIFLPISEKQGQEFFHQFNHCALRGRGVFIFLFSNEGILCGRFNNWCAAKHSVDFGWCGVTFFPPFCQYCCILGFRNAMWAKWQEERQCLQERCSDCVLLLYLTHWKMPVMPHFLCLKCCAVFVPQRQIAV